MTRLHCDNQRKQCPNDGIMFLVDGTQRPFCSECAAELYRRGVPVFLARPIAVTEERIIDGCEPVRVRLFTPALDGLEPCASGRHCAAHCDGPHPCCRCGSQFVELALDEQSPAERRAMFREVTS